MPPTRWMMGSTSGAGVEARMLSRIVPLPNGLDRVFRDAQYGSRDDSRVPEAGQTNLERSDLDRSPRSEQKG